MPVVLLATDADGIHDQVDAALGDDQTTVHRVRSGREVVPAVKELNPDLVVLDLQIGNMGGIATCLSLRSEEGAGRLEQRPVLMLLDRIADVFLARRSDADGWLVKPLDAIRLHRAAEALLGGGTHHEGTGAVPTHDAEPMNLVVPGAAEAANPAEPEQVPTSIAAEQTDTHPAESLGSEPDTAGADAEPSEAAEP